MLDIRNGKELTSLQQSRLYDTVIDVIDRLPIEALDQLLGGYSNDINLLLSTMVQQTELALNLGKSLDSERLDYVERVKASMDETLRIQSWAYFNTTVLSNFNMFWRQVEICNLTQLFPWSSYLLSRGAGKSYMFAYAFVLWRLYSFQRPSFYRQNTIDNQNRKETALITNTMTLAKIHVGKIIEELETNPILSEKLNPNNRAKIGETAIETEIGSILHVRGKDGFIRGLHVGATIVDDLPDESSLYSDEQREKLKEIFKGTITPIVEPYGYLIVSGTPYATAPNEMYNVIKKDKRFASFEYPAIFPDGRPLAPDRYTFEDLLMKRSELGSMVFSREYLVVPIADSSTIFPYEFLMRSTVGMEGVDFAESIEMYPFKMKKVVVGCDFATSGNIGADYTVFACLGVDFQDNFHLINLWRKQGASHNEQIDKIVLWDRLYKPNETICEANGFQGILADMARQRGLKNINKFTTTEGSKKDLHMGWPSMSAIFERGQIKIPFKHGPTRDLVEVAFGEFSSITFRSDKGKLEAVGAHDDIVSSCYIGLNKLRENGSVQVKIDFL